MSGEHTPWTPDRLGDRSGDRVVVTGATNGVGLATARALARAGAHVVLAVRNPDLGRQRASEIGGSTTVAHLDLADLSSVRAFADELSGGIDVLVNNAGTLVTARSETVDGFETTLATNFLGPFALTALLADRVRRAIVIVASDAHKYGVIDLDDPHFRHRKWTVMAAYAQSKLADMLWGLELDRRLRTDGSSVRVTLTHPGWVRSNLSLTSNGPLGTAAHTLASGLARIAGQDPDAGAAPTLFALTEPIPPGSYVGIDSRLGLQGPPTLAARTAQACDYGLAADLWRWAEEQTGTRWPVSGAA